MVKKWNERITITLPKNQMKWLRKTAKSRHKTVSDYIKEILSSQRFFYEPIFDPVDNMTEEELKEVIRIAKTPWLDDEDF